MSVAIMVETPSANRRSQMYGRALSVAIGTAFHPLLYTKVLVQLGHDPYPLTRNKAFIFFGPYRYYLPNGFQYGRYIYEKDGFLGLYNGVGASVCGFLVNSIVSSRVSEYLNSEYPDEPPKANETDAEAFSRHVKKVVKETLAKSAGIIVERPFRVAMIRSMAQFIGGETQYSGLISSIMSTYNETGIKGFFYGLIPQLIGELMILWTTSSIMFLIERCLKNFQGKEESEKLLEAHHDDLQLPPEAVHQLTRYGVSFYVSGFFYHFKLISTLMAVNDSRLFVNRYPYVPSFNNWEDYYDLLRMQGQLKRGSALLRRPYTGLVYFRDGKAYAKSLAEIKS